jgi:hypothetical protein
MEVSNKATPLKGTSVEERYYKITKKALNLYKLRAFSTYN